MKLNQKLTKAKIEEESDRKKVAEEIGELIRDFILDKAASGKSPVKEGKWHKPLSKSYKKRKANESSAGFANLELSGDLLDSLDYTVDDKGNIEIGFFEPKEAAKAYGHNTSYRGHPKITNRNIKREIIPKSNQKFAISDKAIQDIIDDYANKD